jgi:hypothetical protein
MKVYEQKHKEIVRISFGPKHSMSFEDTTVKDVFDLAIRVFSEYKLERRIVFKGNPFDKPESGNKLIVTIRHESGAYAKRGYKGKSKSKTMFGLTGKQAKEYFVENYEKYLL